MRYKRPNFITKPLTTHYNAIKRSWKLRTREVSKAAICVSVLMP